MGCIPPPMYVLNRHRQRSFDPQAVIQENVAVVVDHVFIFSFSDEIGGSTLAAAFGSHSTPSTRQTSSPSNFIS